MFLKLLASLVLGGLIGLERETHGRPAGLRTHILVCLGSTLFTLCSYNIAGKTFDPARISAQIVTGIGFLGAGTIMRQGSVVRGLTTAASIWTVAAKGMAVAIGGGMYLVAVLASLLVVITLNVIPHLERYLQIKHGERILTVVTSKNVDAACRILDLLTSRGAAVRILGSDESSDGNSQILRVRVRHAAEFDENAVSTDLLATDGVLSYSWE